MVRLVKIIKNSGGTKTTVYEGDDGNTYTLQGDIGVRGNNPGNISPSKAGRQFWIDNFGAIGFVPSSPGEPYVAVFPDLATGRAAQQYLWSTPDYQELTLQQAAERWATDAYPEALIAAAGVSGDTLVKDLTPAQMTSIFGAQAAAESSPNLVVLDADGNKLDPAIITGTHPVPPGLMGATPADKLADIHDRNADAAGFGQIPPTPLTRPNYFNETGKPPIPLTRGATPQITDMASLLEALNGLQSDVAMSVTPRMPDNPGQTRTAEELRQIQRGNAPQIDQSLVQARATILDEGLGSLLSQSPFSPATLNSTAQSDLDTLRQLVSGAPRVANTASDTMEPARAGNTKPAPTPQTREPSYGTLKTGKQVEIGKSYKVGDKLMIAEPGPNGTATLRDVEDVRDDWLRKNVDPNAPLLLEDSLAGAAARTIAAPMIKQGVDTAVGNVVNYLGSKASSLTDAATGLVNDTISRFGTASKPPTSANANLTSARNEQAALRQNSSSSSGSALPSSTFVSEDHEKSNAVVPYVVPLAPNSGSSLVSKPVTTTVANPAYADWVAKYGQDGSQVQTAATGGMITKDQLAAIQNVNGAVQQPIAKPAIPAAPPKTITVTRPGNALPTTAPPGQTITGGSTGRQYGVGKNYVSGGYIFTTNPDGTFSKIGKIAPTAAASYDLANQLGRERAVAGATSAPKTSSQKNNDGSWATGETSGSPFW